MPDLRRLPASSDRTSGPTDDTSAETASAQFAMWRSMDPQQKADLITGLTVAVQQLCLAGIRQRHPEASERECMLRLAIIKLGRKLAVEAYPEAASIRGL